MNKASIKNFAAWAKQKLMGDVTYKMNMLGITEKGIAMPLPQSTKDLQFFDIGTKNYAEVHGSDIQKRNALVARLKENDSKSFKAAMDSVIDEVAYTWFNRLIAIRFMEVNNYLPGGIRVLSSENSAKDEPDLVTNPFDSDLEFTPSESDYIINLKQENKSDELFRMLFIKQCNKLNDILPDLFEKTDDYTELLLTISFTDKDGVVYRLVHDIAEDDFNVEKEGQVEILGWLYQFYVADDRQAYRDAKVVTKELIPTLTQVFTTDWIVRYMAENSLGRLWLESYPDSPLKNSMQYYVEDAKQEPEVIRQMAEIKYKNVNPEDIKVIEPCCGSGHILAYVFDLLYKMYEEKGYSAREIPTLILSKNLYGLEIDKRATQLTVFSLTVKAMQYNKRFFSERYFVVPNVVEIYDSRFFIEQDYVGKFTELKIITKKEIDSLTQLIETFRNAKTVGSLLVMPEIDVALIESVIDKLNNGIKKTLINMEFIDKSIELLQRLLKQYKIMSAKYDVMITNPPYLGISKMEEVPKKYLIDHYPDSKSDMFAMFMEAPFVKKNGFKALVNPDSWMFLVSYEKLRKKIIQSKNIVNMVHLGMGAFDATVQTTSFVIRNTPIAGNGVYFRLVDSKNKEQDFIDNLTSVNGGGYRFIINLSRFELIPGSPIAYWVSDKLLRAFVNGKQLSEIASPRQGLATGDNNRFLRFWNEVNIDKVYFTATDYINAFATGAKWFPCTKGGSFRKWYGNNEYIVNWLENGKEIKNFSGSVIRNSSYYFREGGTWSTISSSNFSMRYIPKGYLFESKGSVCFVNEETQLKYVIGFLNSCIVKEILLVLSPTLDYHEGPLGRVPVIIENNDEDKVVNKVEQNISLSKADWDSFETSWDFKKHPLI